ncbi:MAG: carbohydrate ABC transporter permease, partial [Acidimicrobiia bacterium]|nr:carbohydrate ABC transporter permease [Acidimicrobiia bacterium]
MPGPSAVSTPTARIRRFAGYTILAVFALMFIYPFVLTMSSSFKSLPDIQANPVSPLPDPAFGGATTEGITRLDSDQVRFPRWALNSVITTAAVVALRIALDATAGYALARLRFPGRRAIFRLVVAVMAVPAVVLLIPKFLVMRQLGILNSYAGLILPLAFDAFGIFLMKQFFEQLPRELEEAAAIDGASVWQTFTRVMLPLAAPGLIALTILSTQGVWNEFLHMLIAAPSEPDLKTLTVGLAGIRGAFGEAPPWNTILAGSVITTLPIAAIFFTFQRFF